MNRSARIYVAGGRTLIGAAILRRLRAEGCDHLLGVESDEAEGCDHLLGVESDEPDLLNAGQVEDFFSETRPEYVFFAAGKSGGIELNRQCPAELMLDNLLAAVHVVRACYEHKIRKLLYLASSCCYPRNAPQPLTTASLQMGPPEPTNAGYAAAKLAGWQLCAAYRQQYGSLFVTGIPANAFGPHDDFSPDSGHVLPALIRRMHEAKERGDPTLTIWGTGTPRREFIFADDLADACVFAMRHYDGVEPINLGGGTCLSIAEAARMVAEVVGFTGRLVFDTDRPDGMPLKMLDSTPLHRLGWRTTTPFREALTATYDWFVRNADTTPLSPASGERGYQNRR